MTIVQLKKLHMVLWGEVEERGVGNNGMKCGRMKYQSNFCNASKLPWRKFQLYKTVIFKILYSANDDTLFMCKIIIIKFSIVLSPDEFSMLIHIQVHNIYIYHLHLLTYIIYTHNQIIHITYLINCTNIKQVLAEQ